MEEHDKIKTYTNGEITVVWQASKCLHSGNCVRHLSAVFKPKELPWVQMDNASSDEIRNAVSKCPSGALTIK